MGDRLGFTPVVSSPQVYSIGKIQARDNHLFSIAQNKIGESTIQ